MDHKYGRRTDQRKKPGSSNIAILREFLIKQLFHSRFLVMVSYPTRAYEIIKNTTCGPQQGTDVKLLFNVGKLIGTSLKKMHCFTLLIIDSPTFVGDFKADT